jgi:protein involved in polysaccharide export with SLBB domain
MRLVVGVLSALLIFGGVAVNAHALSEQEIRELTGGDGARGNLLSGSAQQESSSGTMQTASPGMGNYPLNEDLRLFKKLQESIAEGDEFFEKEEVTTRLSQGMGTEKIILRVEPGDGLVSVDWRVPGLKQGAGDPPLKFALFYGTQSGRLSSKIEVGSATSHRIRGLRNSQIYYLRVMGYREGKTIVSPEEKVTPLELEQQPSSLERSFAGKTVTMHDSMQADPFKRELKQFGYEFFRNSLATALSTDNLPVGGDYILGPGDTLQIDLWGSIRARSLVEVDRAGEIAIPKVGIIKVWGLSYDQAKEVINKSIARYYKGYELNVTLGKLKTVQVFVVGEVENPGMYTVGSLSTVMNALSAAGGPSRGGSLRTIKVLKKGKVSQEIDLYDIFLSGDRSRDIRLDNGDTLFVPVIGRVVAIAGEVKRPGIYELKEKSNLKEVLAMAGGITASGYTGSIQLERIEGNSTRVILDHEAKKGGPQGEQENVLIEDRDMIKVFPVSKVMHQVVRLSGNVVRSGEYQYKPGMKVTDLIPDYEALLPDFYLEAATVTRVVPPDMHKEVISFNLGNALKGDPNEDIQLREQDNVTVFSRWDMQEKPVISISGQVANPGTYDFYRNMTIRDLIVAAGSLKRNAFLDKAELTRVVVESGKARAERVDVNLARAISGDPDNNLELHADDALIVRGVENWLDAQDRFVTVIGEVRFPGTYSIGKGEKLSSVIARAGGFTDRAYLKGSKFIRKSVQELQQKRLVEVLAKAEFDILQKQGEVASVASSREELEATRASLEGLLKSVQKLKERKAEGRVVIRLAPLDEFRESPYDLEAMGGDTIEIPQVSKVVSVLGYVYNSTSFVHMPDSNIAYYLKKAGGATRDAEEDDMFVVKVDGTVVSKQQSSFGIHWDDGDRRWSFGGFNSVHPDPGDTLVVPQKLERIAWMREIKDITTILSQIALTAGVIVAAGL